MILNGLPFRNQTVSVSVNGEGVVTSYEARIWSGEAPKLEIPIAKREIDLIFNRRFLKPLAYIVWSPHDEPVLGYRIGERYSDFFFIEATTGLVRRPDGFGYEATSLILETSKHWAGPEIKRLISMGVISPVYENFVSNELVTRGQFVRYLARAIKISPLYPEGDAFSDVTRENTDFGYIEAVAEVNIVLGSNGKFSPSGNITREEVAVILARILAEAEPAEIGQKEFKDAGTIASWAKEGVKVAVSKGLIKGDQRGNFNPKNNVTQAELAVMLSRLIDGQEF